MTTMTSAEALALVQGTPKWRQARAGFLTASRAKDAFDTTTKGAYTAEHAKYVSELICERLTGIPYPRYVTAEMQWGIDHEAEARDAYELKMGVLVDQVGFVIHPSIPNFGCSPDGLVGDDGMIQIKCPTTLKHLTWWREGIVPIEHRFQIVAELACSGRKWCDFVSYDPRLPEHLQLFIRRLDRDEKLIASTHAEARQLNTEIDQVLRGLPAAPQPIPQPIAEVLQMPTPDELNF